MSAAPILAVRKALVTHLKADLVVTAALPAARIFGERADSSAWPFSRMGEFEGNRLGQDVSGNIHVFSKGEFSDEAATLTELIGNSVDGAVLALADGRRCIVELANTRLLADPEEQSAWHGIASIVANVTRDCTAS